jgi:hypothetical protein
MESAFIELEYQYTAKSSSSLTLGFQLLSFAIFASQNLSVTIQALLLAISSLNLLKV